MIHISEHDEDKSPLLALCIEFATMAAAAEENAAMRDIYISAYTYPMPLAVIRENDTQKTKRIFSEFCPNWTDEQFEIMENLYSGIEYGTFSSLGNSGMPSIVRVGMPDDLPLESGTSLDLKVASGLNAIMQLYNVPEELRQQKIKKIIAMDYRNLGRKILSDFRHYITAVNWQAVESARQSRMKQLSHPKT